MECEYFNSFRHFEPDIQFWEVTHADKPDFRIRLGSTLIGVEVRRLHTPLADPAIESTQESVLAQACSMAERQGLPPADVRLFANFVKPLRVADRTQLAEALVRVVGENMPADGESIDLEHRPGQPREIDLILINRRDSGDRGRWQWLEMRSRDGNITGIVRQAIAEKAARLESYLTTCDECWLLLVADSFMASGTLEIDQTTTFSSTFARTYILSFGRGRLFRLQGDGRFSMTGTV